MFKEYMHIERLGNDEVGGILNGECYVFPKIDGTNASVWMDDGYIRAGSRKRELRLEEDNAGFCEFATMDQLDVFQAFLTDYPHLRIYGEWLVPHTLRTYRKDAWRKFYVFDVYDHDLECYLGYEEYSHVLLGEGLPFPIIAPIEIVTNPTQEHLIGLLDRNTYLIEDGNGPGEGLVIKRYDYTNEWGHTVWAKIVRNEFKERNLEAFGTPTVKMKGDVEGRLAGEYATRGRITKMLAEMRDAGPVSRRCIPELFGRVWHNIITEEMWEIIKANKNPAIDFSRFYGAVIEEIKHNCPELFG
ncbi:hypothetical protein KKF82_06185 [Patescibacteria group bacterium]|nr:hypothetical protein [Patescibacteria group bacterium]